MTTIYPTDLAVSTIGKRKPTSIKNDDDEVEREISMVLEYLKKDSIFFEEHNPRDLPQFSEQGKYKKLFE
jgi:hypothetical protein